MGAHMDQTLSDQATSFARRVTSIISGQPEDADEVILKAEQFMQDADLRDFATRIAEHLAKPAPGQNEADDETASPR